ncbi:MAG: glycosyltransferase [Aeromonas hydrophila]
MYQEKKKSLILLAAYNGGSLISAQLDSILLQNNIDLVISVDLSNDNTFSICKLYAEKHKNIILLPYGEQFGGAGKNFYRLLKDTDISSYDYIGFSDQDDIWLESKLTKGIEKLQQYDCYSANVTAFWEDGREVLIDKAQPQREWDFLFEAAGPGCTYVFKREVALKFKTWLEERYDKIGKDIALHDWLLYAFSRSQGYSWFIDPEPTMLYRQHAGNQVGTNNSFGAAKKRLKLIKDKWYRQQVTNIVIHLGLKDSPIHKKGLSNNYIGNLYLLAHIGKLRRRFRDRCALAFVLLFNIF